MIWYIAFGSAVGGVSRYLLGGYVQRLSGGTFPLGTLLINVTGSFLLGLISRYALDSAAISAEVRGLLTIGFCGGYTTFSSFSLEAVRQLEDGDYARAGLYIALSVGLSLAATILGIVAAKELLLLRRAS
jgi:CrcB protein